MENYRSRKEVGSALVELALTLPLFLCLLLGTAEIGRIAYAAVEVQNAARAGAAYGAANLGNAVLTTSIADAAKYEGHDIASLTATATDSCICEEITNSTGAITLAPISVCAGTGATAATDCPTSTTNGVTNNIVSYVTVTTTATVHTMFTYNNMFKHFGLPSTFTLNGYSKMRVLQNTTGN